MFFILISLLILLLVLSFFFFLLFFFSISIKIVLYLKIGRYDEMRLIEGGTSPGRCSCQNGWEGPYCDQKQCPTTTTTKMCSGHGQCLAETCYCRDGYTGTKHKTKKTKTKKIKKTKKTYEFFFFLFFCFLLVHFVFIYNFIIILIFINY